MASLSHSSPCKLIKSPSHPKSRKYHHRLTCQSFRDDDDQGKWGNNVDANLVLLRERIEGVRRKEMLEKKASRVEEIHDWRYNNSAGRFYDDEEKHKKRNVLAETMQVLALAGATTLAYLFLFLCFCILSLYYLVSSLLHLTFHSSN